MGADMAIEVDKRVDTDMAIGMLACGRGYASEACRRVGADMQVRHVGVLAQIWQSRQIFMPVKEFPELEIRVFRSASVRRADKEGTFGSSVYVGDNRFIIDSGFQSGCRVALPLFL